MTKRGRSSFRAFIPGFWVFREVGGCAQDEAVPQFEWPSLPSQKASPWGRSIERQPTRIRIGVRSHILTIVGVGESATPTGLNVRQACPISSTRHCRVSSLLHDDRDWQGLSFKCLPKHSLKGVVVRFFFKQCQPRHSPVEHVKPSPRRADSGRSRHPAIVPQSAVSRRAGSPFLHATIGFIPMGR